jgi:uncharacterized membrane protein (UPF0182 family)
VIILVCLIVLLPFLAAAVKFYTDWLFFTETGFRSVFTTTLYAKLATGLVFACAMAAALIPNILRANRIEFRRTGTFSDGRTIYQFRVSAVEKLTKPLSLLGTGLLALLAGQWGAMQWEKVLLFANGAKVGINDPVLRYDLGFYLFQLPLLEAIRSFLWFVLICATLGTCAIYYLRGGFSITVRGLSADSRVRRHLAVLAGLFMLLAAGGFYLDSFGLLYSGTGTVNGAGYADVNARLPVYRLLMALTPAAAIVVAAAMWRGRWRLAALAPAAVILIYALGVQGFPAVLQKFKVAPNELALEMPYLAYDIRFTRLGYDLDKIQTIPFDVEYKLTGSDIAANDPTVRNIRLWDHAPLLRTYSQLQQIRTYYKFFDVDNDRYTVNGRYTQVMLSPRELSYADLPNRNWINERLIFTHGNGLTFGPVSRISREGLPEFLVKDIPAVSLADIKISRPEIYYGELSNDYVVVRTKIPEFSYPTATGNITTKYSGRGGVSLDSFFRRIAFALRFRTEKILLSSDIVPDSRILYYRNIGERVRALAPFLRFEADPYMVVTDDGRLKWMVDAFTTSDRMPYSKPLRGGVNYMRNSVKAVVDAYDGTVDFYISDPGDVIIKAYAGIFPKLFKPLSAMPGTLKAHVRYPHQFLQIQAAMFSAYHMTDAKVFYNRENLWEVPVIGEKTMEPYYTVMKLPGEKKEEYILLLPFTPAKRDNLAAWLTARCDQPNYGKLLVYTFPRDRLIYGPKQVDARINQDSYISQQLTLWNQRGSEVIRGSMLIIPIERSLLYVQPLYLAASDKTGLPELRRVIVSYENQVVMEDNLELALQRLFSGVTARTGDASRAAAPLVQTSVRGMATDAVRSFERAISLQKQGDWAGYGQELKNLEGILRRMAK